MENNRSYLGTEQAEVFYSRYSTGISIAAGGGTDTLVIQPYSSRTDLTRDTFALLSGIDEVRAASVSNFLVEASLFAGITKFDSGDTAAMPSRVMYLLGDSLSFDFANKVLVGFSK